MKRMSQQEAATAGDTVAPKKVRSRYKPRSIFVGALIAVAMFALGVNVGNGRISFAHGDNASQLPSKLDYSSVNEVYNVLKANYYEKLTPEQLLDGMKEGLAKSTGDPYTEYFTAAQAKEFNQQLSNSFSGIGAQLGKDDKDNLQVIAPVKGTPADKAGLRAKDIIATIDGQSTEGMSVDAAVHKIRGEAGTKVKLGLVRDGKEAITLEITRDNFTVPSVETKVENGVGIMTINSFAPDTAQLAEQAANSFKDQGVKKMILDLRDNPGGEVDAAVSVASLWLPSGKQVFQEKRGSTVTQTYESKGTATLQGIPTVILINGGSASASEIVAGALKDNDAATVIGEKSYGKGVVQSIEDLSGGAQLKVTIASWYRPNGQNIHKKGITPDKEVKRTVDDIKAQKDPQLDAAKAVLGQ